MRKKLLLSALLCLCVALFAACGGQPENGGASQSGSQAPAAGSQDTQAPGASTGGEEASEAGRIEALAGTTLAGGSTLETAECAVMTSYYFENPDGTQASLDALQEQIEAYAQENGYVPVVTSGEGDKVYSVMPNELDGLSVVVLGESDSLKPGVESEGTRRFAQRNVLWQPLNGSEAWQVLSVEQQDYYEENGVQYPCYFMILAQA